MIRLGKNEIPYKYLYVITVVTFVLLDTRFNVPYNTVLRWLFPAFLLILCAFSGKRTAIVFPSKEYLLMLAYFALSIIWSPVVGYSFQRWVSLLLIIGMFSIYYTRLTEWNRLDEIIRPLGVIFVLYGIVNLFFLGTVVDERSVGVTGNANSLGLEANIALSFASYFYERAESKHRIPWIVLMVLLAFAAVMSGSRTAALLLALFFVYFFCFVYQHRFFAIAVPLLLLTLTFLPGNLLSSIPILNRLNTLGLGRGELWEYAFSVFLRKPVFGHGFGAMKTTTSMDVSEGLGYHSSFLTILVETGAVGLILVFLVLVPPIVRGIKLYKKTGSLEIRIVLLLAVEMLFSFYGESSMTSVGSTEGFFFWGLITWLMIRGKYDGNEIDNQQHTIAAYRAE